MPWELYSLASGCNARKGKDTITLKSASSNVGVHRSHEHGYDIAQICIGGRYAMAVRYMRVPTALTHYPMAFQQVVPPLDILIIEMGFLIY